MAWSVDGNIKGPPGPQGNDALVVSEEDPGGTGFWFNPTEEPPPGSNKPDVLTSPVQVSRNSGNITATVTAAWADLDPGGTAAVRPLDVVLPGMSVGDGFTIKPSFNSVAVTGGFLCTAAVIVDGEVQRNIFGSFGYVAWGITSGLGGFIHAECPRQIVQSGDLVDGTLRVRLRYIQATNNRTISADALIPLHIEGRGPLGTSRFGLVFDGQSGVYSPANGIPVSLRTMPHLNEIAGIEVVGLSGTTYAQRDSTKQDRSFIRFRNFGTAVLVDVAGQSDVLAASPSASAILAAMEAYHTAAKAAGALRTVICTVADMGESWGMTSSKNTVRLALNDLIRGSSVFDAVADVAALPESQDPLNTTWYSDGIHPTAALAELWAQEIAAAVNGLDLQP